ncbi:MULTISPECIES: alpha-L-fucosidase [unclassified Oceanispirochaeta]|uniref:alpha-L-fucosidase n=1 Tax=unclassified Oceanispirochaeta TaxID=2635722 RepID=UPI000E08F5DF|nr:MULTISPECIES: alpha-L-fucosidase [unclassified Oceanispirochaeta]MBF9017575.1 alpha-L-fucosidase [Oceanispirochaeta sp. M2]NPD74147.1 alpha-L-fucosidase [Oceanispirochaeta sp. M1]RDG30066.1 alpha-L-fucosidase [Oceanispirochaeta sp. M1]
MSNQNNIQKWKDRHFGMFIHYGLYSLPAGVWKGEKITYGYSEQILSHAAIDKNEYDALMNDFTAENFDARAITSLAKAAGMNYLVITTKHHDGFCLFKTETTEYNSFKSAAKRDLVAELADACQKEGIGLGLYFSWIDWDSPAALSFSDHNSDTIPEAHQQLNIAQLTELLSNYGPICEMWFDMGKPTVDQSRQLADLVRELQPEAMINGRIWNNQDDFIVLADNEIPEFSMNRPWQTPASIYHETWGYREWQLRENLDDKIREQIRNLATISALGGNHLLNIGPMGDGSIVPFEDEVLRGIGSWINVNREAVFDVEPGFWENEYWGYSTLKGNSIYLQIHSIPESGKIELKNLKTAPLSASLLSNNKELTIIEEEGNFSLVLKGLDKSDHLPVIKLDFSRTPELDLSHHISAGQKLKTEGRKDWSYQGEDYYSYKPCIESQSWTVVPDADGQLRIDMTCLAGQKIEISLKGSEDQNGKIQGVDEELFINAALRVES